MNLNDVAAGSVARKYLAKCRDMKAAADERFTLQVEVLKHASQWGLHDRIWKYAKAQHAKGNSRVREMFLASPLPRYIWTAYKKSGDDQPAEEVASVVSKISDMPEFPEDVLRLTVLASVESGNYRQAGKQLDQQKRVPESWRVRFSQQVLDSILDQQKLDEALTLIDGVRNPLWREAALSYVASRSTRSGAAERVWKKSGNRDWTATERIAWLRGLVVGIAVQDGASETAAVSTNASSTGE